MKRKEVADVMGGKDEWANADSMASEYTLSSLVCGIDWSADGYVQRNVRRRIVMAIEDISTSCRFEVQTSQ